MLDPQCIFCKIVSGDIPAALLEREPGHIAFRDINAQAPEHILVVPTRHIPALSKHGSSTELGELVAAAARIGVRIGGNGFRLVVNEGPDGGQTVDHLHVHVLAGRSMNWPPG